MQESYPNRRQKPDWLKIKLPGGEKYRQVKDIVEKNKLHTICSSGRCPNLGECWGAGTATFMILGEICTRSCGFCATKTGRPQPVDVKEPLRVAESVRLMKLRHCVITSVDRDDLPDGGASIWAATVNEVRKLNPDTTIEVLLPDFGGNHTDLKTVLDTHPDIAAHNLETVRRLTPLVRSAARYDRSLEVVRNISLALLPAKSGVMVGLGETKDEVLETMDDLIKAGCRILTIGQYLQPSAKNLPVEEYIHPDLFEEYRIAGLTKGFKTVESNPLVRSSYHAEDQVQNSTMHSGIKYETKKL
ncbi:MAG TPA: lipoyl synthase [Bacteroidales bacterium]|nr:lipoyl synthase [Bacteroidales bacterium]